MILASSRDQNRGDPVTDARQLKAFLIQVLYEVVDPGKVLVNADVTGLLSDQTARSTSKISESRWSQGAKVRTRKRKGKFKKNSQIKKKQKNNFFLV